MRPRRNTHLFLIVLITFSTLLVGCSTKRDYKAEQPVVSQTVCPPSTIFFEYEDFGPQVMAHELLGMDWYQWQPHGDPDPNSTDRVRVIVYIDIELSKVQKLYPVDPRKNQDYRYVHIDRAISFLQNKTKELDEYEDDETNFAQLRKRLQNTLNRLLPLIHSRR